MNEEVVFNYQNIETSSDKVITPWIKISDFLGNRIVALILGGLVVIYTLLVTIRISFDTETEPYSNELDILEIIFLAFFVIEVILKILAYRVVRFI